MFKRLISIFKSVKKTYLLALLLSGILLGGQVYLLRSSSNLPPQVPLWFSKTWGENQLSDPDYLWLIPAASGAFLIINSLLGRFIQKREPTVASIAIWSTVIISFAAALTLYQILMVVSP